MALIEHSITTKAIHSDVLGEWVIVDDDPSTGHVQIIPISYAHRQILTRDEARERFALDNREV